MISDDIVRASSSRAPEAGPAGSALALLAHQPGLSIRMLAVGVGLSHAGTVRLGARPRFSIFGLDCGDEF